MEDDKLEMRSLYDDKEFSEATKKELEKNSVGTGCYLDENTFKQFKEIVKNPGNFDNSYIPEHERYVAKYSDLEKYLEWRKAPMYQMIASESELRWFFDHVIQKPKVNESYSAVFVSRHKKLTDEELKTFGLTRKEGEFLATQTFRMRNIKDASRKDDPELWTFEQFLSRVKRFNVDKGAYTTGTGEPLPTKTLAIIFYVNPGDDMKVCKKFIEEYNDVNEAISKAMLNGKTTDDNLQSYQWFGNAESTIKHLKANCRGSRYWMDFDIDVPAWFKQDIKYCSVCGTGEPRMEEEDLKAHIKYIKEKMENPDNKPDTTYLGLLRIELDIAFGKGNYVIVDTSGGYHILVRTSAIKADPHKFCKKVKSIYDWAVESGMEPYLDEKGNCKFECVVNDSQIPGLPLPGTYQYGRPVTVLNKEDFDGEDFVKEALKPGNETVWLGDDK